MMFDIEKIREQFPILSRKVNGKELIYLDSAATSQKPQRVIDRIARIYQSSNANIHRGIHTLAEECTWEYEQAREKVARTINARSTREVVFTSGATASINTVAYSFALKYFSAGDNMVVTEMEHHSNIVPWQLMCERYGVELRVLPFSDEGDLRLDLLGSLLDERTRMVAVTHTSNVLGTNNDVKSIAEIVRQSCDARVLIDGCQGIVHNEVDVQALGVDFYAFSGHKIYAPTGNGVLWARE
ncbi:MAG: aminotransferase class V-fold PLP-dependent enzyme, partial [Rikenellaceae bacterium]